MAAVKEEAPFQEVEEEEEEFMDDGEAGGENVSNGPLGMVFSVFGSVCVRTQAKGACANTVAAACSATLLHCCSAPLAARAGAPAACWSSTPRTGGVAAS